MAPPLLLPLSVPCTVHRLPSRPHSKPIRPSAHLAQFAPTRAGFLRFMAESKVVYDTFEGIAQQQEGPHAAFCECALGIV